MRNLFKYIVVVAVLLTGLVGCGPEKKPADLIVYNASIYTVDSLFSVQEAMAIRNGKILAVGTTEFIQRNYVSHKNVNADGNAIFPGFIDAHCHFYGYGKGLSEVDLVGTTSYESVIGRILDFIHYNPEFMNVTINDSLNYNWIIGRGWDQNDWLVKEYPDNRELDSLFPTQPVMLTRIDGHAAVVNSMALKLAGITAESVIPGGEIILKDGQLTGVLIDNAVDSVQKIIPKPSEEEIMDALLDAEENCLAVGLTTVDDAGLEKRIVDAIDKLHKRNILKMRVYAMLTANEENFDYYLKNGTYETERLNVRAFKFYADGALGSRGACLCAPYADKPDWHGFLLNDIANYDSYAEMVAFKGFQMNTHCIGDSAAKVMLGIYSKYIDGKPDMRWRIEHAQVLTENSFTKFSKNIIPSVQPTHATSDMYWAESRLGPERIKLAYAYKRLLEEAGMIALGTDFPVEDISPFKTFYAAVARKDDEGFPTEGFQMENALSRKDALRGMTIWAAYANFEEKKKGSLEPGKYADFVLLDTDIMKCPESDITESTVIFTYINGERVFDATK